MTQVCKSCAPSGTLPRVVRCGIIILLCMALAAAHLPAQPSGLRFKHLGIADGLSQSSVYSLLQDKKGFIWIGTTDGLSRYDGYAFRHFKYDQGNPYTVSSNELQSLAQAPDGSLLVGTSVGLDVYDHNKEQFYRVPVQGEDTGARYVKTIYTDSRGTIWVGTGKGLATYDPVKRILVPASLRGISAKTIAYSVAEDAANTLWFGIGRAVVHYDPVRKQTIPLPASLEKHPAYGHSGVFVVAPDTAGKVWIGTEREGVLMVDMIRNECYQFNTDTRPEPVSNDMIRAIGFHEGNTWIGTRNGLYVINGNRAVLRHYKTDRNDATSLSGNSVLCMMKDNAGSMWVGTFAGGVSIEQPGNDNFSYITERIDTKPGLNYPVVSRILEDAVHNLWIATEGGGVNVYNRTTGQFSYIHVNPASQHLVNQETIKAIQFDEKGNLWIGTLEGLFYYEVASHRVQPVVLKEKDRLSDEVVYALAYRDGELWIGTKAGLFHRKKDGSLQRFRHNKEDEKSIISDDINALICDRAGGIWIGTELGLSYLPPGQSSFTNYLSEYAKVFNKNAILCIYEDQHGNCWIGTRGGGLKLFNRQQNKFYTLDTAWGLANNIVHGVIEDRQGNIWVSFNQGIARITLKKALPPFAKEDILVTNYSVNNGLGSNEFLAAAYRTADGHIMFGGVNGIVSFLPEKLVTNKVPPPVAFTDLLIKNIPVAIRDHDSPLQQSITYTDHITLTYDQAFFTIRFAALNYINAKTNQYAYLLEGLHDDKQWHYVGNQQSATYTNLDAGEYTFKVKAANNDGYWNEQYASLHIKVLPPIWKTWYAYVLYVLIIAALLYLFYFYSVRTTHLRNQLALQQLNRQKDQELVQRKLSFFTNISHEIKTPLTLVLAPVEKLLDMMQGKEKETAQLQLMQRNGERLLKLTNQLLDFRKFEAGSMPLEVSEGDVVVFVRAVVASFEGYARQQRIQLHVVAEQEGESAAWFDEDKLEKILYNLLSNAFKFTPAGGYIRVTVNCDQQHIEIRVEDNGAGIAAEHLTTIFDPFRHYNDTGKAVSGTGIGLAFTKGLVQLHHGTITAESKQAAPDAPGFTCFTVTLPAARNAYTAEEIKTVPAMVVQDQTMASSIDHGTVLPEETVEGEGGLPAMLIVEDNAEVLSLLAMHFNERFVVHTAPAGQEGWETAIELLPDIIISDVMMPGMSGTQLCTRLKQDSRTSHIPVVLLTARSQLNYQIEGYETGADEYVTKPFNLSLLDVRVNNLLQSRRLLRERYSRDITLQPSQLAITPADEVFLGNVMAFIEDNLMEPTLQVEELGKVVNMSRTTLYRKVKALTGQSVIEFIRGVRLKRAAQLLQRREYTVNEIAYMTGFSDVDYFRKCFKQEFGKTPREYAEHT